MRTQLLLVVAVGLLVAADKQKEAGRKGKEAEKLLGTWKLVAIESSGKREKVNGGTMVLTRDKVTFKIGGRTEEARYVVDASKRPKQFDVIYTGESDPERKGTAKGIYELDGDKLTICGNAIGSEPRPKELKTREKDGLTLGVFERVKP